MLKDQKGVALPTVLLIIVVLSMLGMTLLAVSANEAVRASHHEKKTKAYYIARSGADAVAKYIVDQGKLLDSTAIAQLERYFVDNVTLGEGTINIKIEPTTSPMGIKIKSLGQVGNAKELVTRQLLETEWSFPHKGLMATDPGVSAYIGAYGKLTVDGQVDEVRFTTRGPMVKYDDLSSVGEEGKYISVSETHPPAGDKAKHEVKALPTPPSAIFPILPIETGSLPALPITINHSVNHSKNYGDEILNGSYNIDVSERKNYKLVFDKLTLNGLGLNIINHSLSPSGNVYIYANEITTTFSINAIKNIATGSNVILYVKNKIEVTYNGTAHFSRLILYAPDAELVADYGSFSFQGGSAIVKNLNIKDKTTTGTEIGYYYYDDLTPSVPDVLVYKLGNWGGE
jgi:hypothetical protein